MAHSQPPSNLSTIMEEEESHWGDLFYSPDPSAQKIGINGFGRIGRNVLRAASLRGLTVTHINIRHITDLHDMVNKLVSDESHRHFRVNVSRAKKPGDVKWGEAGVDLVIESSGVLPTVAQAGGHLKGGAKKVIITALSADAPMFVMGVNHFNYQTDMHVISSASCTANCLAPLASVIHDTFKIEKGQMMTFHASTASPKTVDGVSGQTLEQAATANTKAVMGIIPALNEKLKGTVIDARPQFTIVELTCHVKKPAKLADIKKVIGEAAKSDRWKEILGYSEGGLVSSDVVTSTFSSVFDAEKTVAMGDHLIRLSSWYDNEFGYSCRVVDLAKYILAQLDVYRCGPLCHALGDETCPHQGYVVVPPDCHAKMPS